MWERRVSPFTTGNRFSLLQRPRSQDIITQQNKNIYNSVENDSCFFSPKRKLKFGRRGNLVLEGGRHKSKFLDNNGDLREGPRQDAKILIKSKVYSICSSERYYILKHNVYH